MNVLLKERLAQLREVKGVRKKDVALILNIDQTTYGKYELGKRQPSLESLYKLAEYFNVTTDYLLGRSDNLNPPGKEESTPEAGSVEWFKIGLTARGIDCNEITEAEFNFVFDNIGNITKMFKSFPNNQ